MRPVTGRACSLPLTRASLTSCMKRSNLEKDGLLYRGARTVNWCPKHQTSLSNLEVDYQERTDPFYYFQYGPFVIGTARPETKFGDKYVVMHPEDERYAEYEHGQQLEVEWINGPITATVIKDEAGDPEMGSGAMTITPWHSNVDFEIAKRHDLEYEQVIDWRGKLLPIAEEFAGMNITEARTGEKLDEKDYSSKSTTTTNTPSLVATSVSEKSSRRSGSNGSSI